MPVETIECQIVQAQLGRYLAGDALPGEAVSDLEAHIVACPLCRDEVARRRAALQALLGGDAHKRQPTEDLLVNMLREKSPANTAVAHAVLEQPVTKEPSPRKQLFGKPMLYGGGLAMVLIAMSYLGNNPTSIFGDRAAGSLPAAGTTIQAPAVDKPVTETSDAALQTSGQAPAAIAEEEEEPITQDNWFALGLDEFIPYGDDAAQIAATWEWATIADTLPEATPESEDGLVAADSPTTESPDPSDHEATLQDWELFSQMQISEPEATTPAKPVKKPVTKPHLRKPPVSWRSKTFKRPNSIKVYAPGQ